jgi:hypothetical protein
VAIIALGISGTTVKTNKCSGAGTEVTVCGRRTTPPAWRTATVTEHTLQGKNAYGLTGSMNQSSSSYEEIPGALNPASHVAAQVAGWRRSRRGKPAPAACVHCVHLLRGCRNGTPLCRFFLAGGNGTRGHGRSGGSRQASPVTRRFRVFRAQWLLYRRGKVNSFLCDEDVWGVEVSSTDS